MAENINISPDMINNLVNMLKNTKTPDENSTSSSSSNNSNSNETYGIFSNFASSSDSGSNFDVQTIMRIKSIIDTMNKKDDPKSKLLYSLKPYLRKSKQDKLDQYVNILKISQVTSLFKEGDSK